jgi:hypothetical protein
MKNVVKAAAIAAFANLALAKEMVPDAELGRTLYDSGIRHMEIMNHKEVRTIPNNSQGCSVALTLGLGFLG